VQLGARPAPGQLDAAGPATAAAAPAPPRPAVRPLYQEQVRRDAQSAAEQIKAEAQQQAAELVAQAAQAAEALRNQAEEEAAQLLQAAEDSVAQREAQLEQRIRQQLAQEFQERYLKSLQALEGAAADLDKRQEEYLEAIEQPAFELVLAVARQVLGRELADPAGSLPALIAQAFQLLRPQQPLQVFVSPATFQSLAESELFADALARGGVRPERIELEIDSALGEGQFRAESAGSYIACDLPALMEELSAHLRRQAALNLGLAGEE
jgi:flagellar biosynthesis/type III secretory pathway protein FliH